jgi:hypothetical protein
MATYAGLARHGPRPFLFSFVSHCTESPTGLANHFRTGTAQSFPPNQIWFKILKRKLKIEMYLRAFL